MSRNELQAKLREMPMNLVNFVSVYESLIAVIALHTDLQTGPRNRGKSGLRARCTECGFAYPCSTIQAIELGMVE